MTLDQRIDTILVTLNIYVGHCAGFSTWISKLAMAVRDFIIPTYC